MSIVLATSSGTAVTPVFVQMLLVVGIIAIGVFLTISIRGKISRRQAATLPPAERIAQVKQQRLTVQDEHAISAQLHDTARRLAAQLDNKAERLEQLLAEAEERIARLEQLSQGQAPPQPVSSNATRPPVPARSNPGEPELRLAKADPEPASAPANRAATETLDPLTRSVYELADAGHEPVAIAQSLDEQIGKVELILALRAS